MNRLGRERFDVGSPPGTSASAAIDVVDAVSPWPLRGGARGVLISFAPIADIRDTQHHRFMNRRMSLSRAVVAALISVSASPAQSAPPPPPKEANLKSLQSYIRGLNQGLAELYASALADDLNVTVGDQVAAKSKSEWMNSILSRLTRGYNQNVTVERVYYGGSQSSAGDYEGKAILVERADRIFGDCCVFHRVETLTFRPDGLIGRIDRSAELNLELKSDGHRQDGLPGTP